MIPDQIEHNCSDFLLLQARFNPNYFDGWRSCQSTVTGAFLSSQITSPVSLFNWSISLNYRRNRKRSLFCRFLSPSTSDTTQSIFAYVGVSSSHFIIGRPYPESVLKKKQRREIKHFNDDASWRKGATKVFYLLRNVCRRSKPKVKGSLTPHMLTHGRVSSSSREMQTISYFA